MDSLLPVTMREVVLHYAGRKILEIPALNIATEGITFLLGANGAGKSTMLRVLHGLLRTKGSIHWGAQTAAHVRSQQAFVAQRAILLRRSVWANLVYPLRVRGLPRAERTRRAQEALRAADVETLVHRPARSASVGEQQRIALARAWALEPRILLLDEPTAHLDPAATLAVEQVVRGFSARGVKIFWATHDLAQTRRLGADVVFLDAGCLGEYASVESFFRCPQCASAKRLLEALQ